MSVSLISLTFASGLSAFLAFITASFLFWRSLRDDYEEEDILTFTILTALWGLLGGRILYVVTHLSDFGFDIGKWFFWIRFPGLSLLGALLAGVLFTFYWARKKSWDFWLLADSVIFACLPAFLLGTLGAFISSLEKIFLWRFFWLVFVFLLSIFILRNFRKFLWYKSGKPGFFACSAGFLWLAGTAALDFWQGTGLYWEKFLALGIAVVVVVFLYRRSERRIKEDIRVAGHFLLLRFKKESK